MPSGAVARRVLCGAALLLLSTSIVIAQTADPQTPQPSPRFETEVVVTPERGATNRGQSAAATTVIDREELRWLPATHPAEVLASIPGFAVSREGFSAGRPVVSSRGFFGGGEAEYISLLVDGVPMADVESGLADWSAVPMTSIRRIEAVRGPGGALYGDAAVGGVVQIFTDPLPAVRVNTEVGSHGSVLGDVTFGQRRASHGLSVSGVARRTDGDFDHAKAHLLVGSGTADGQRSGLGWRWTGSLNTREHEDPGPLSRPAFAADPYQSSEMYRHDGLTRRGYSSAVMLQQARSRWKPRARFTISRRSEDQVRTLLLAPEFGDRSQRDLSSWRVGGSVDGESEWLSGTSRAITVRAGLDLARERLDTSYAPVSESGAVDEIAARADGHRTRSGLYAQAFWDPSSRLRVSGGARWDRIADQGFSPSGSTVEGAWSPRATAVWQINTARTWQLVSQASRTFKAPTLDQRFDPRPFPDFQGGSFTISNRALVAQRATEVEAGVVRTGRITGRVTGYAAAVENEIDFDVRTFAYANIRESRHRGVELDLATSLWTRVRPSVSYAHTRVTVPDGDQQLKNVPRHRVMAAVQVEGPWALNVFTRLRQTAGGFLDDDNVFAIDDGARVDVRVSRRLGRHDLFVDVLNAAGQRFEEYGFVLTDFSGRPAPFVYAGAPRAVRIGLNWSFER